MNFGFMYKKTTKAGNSREVVMKAIIILAFHWQKTPAEAFAWGLQVKTERIFFWNLAMVVSFFANPFKIVLWVWTWDFPPAQSSKSLGATLHSFMIYTLASEFGAYRKGSSLKKIISSVFQQWFSNPYYSEVKKLLNCSKCRKEMSAHNTSKYIAVSSWVCFLLHLVNNLRTYRLCTKILRHITRWYCWEIDFLNIKYLTRALIDKNQLGPCNKVLARDCYVLERSNLTRSGSFLHSLISEADLAVARARPLHCRNALWCAWLSVTIPHVDSQCWNFLYRGTAPPDKSNETEYNHLNARIIFFILFFVFLLGRQGEYQKRPSCGPYLTACMTVIGPYWPWRP